MEILRIKSWNDKFKNSKSRTIDNLSWCPISNQVLLSVGYGNLMSRLDGSSIFGVYNAIILICSTQNRPREGYLTNDGKISGVPLTLKELSFLTSIPENTIYTALNVLKSPEIGWITVVG